MDDLDRTIASPGRPIATVVAVVRAIAFVAAGVAVLIVAALAGEAAKPWAGEDLLVWIDLGVWLVATFLVGRFARRSAEVWCLGLGMLGILLQAGSFETAPGATSFGGLVLVAAVATAVTVGVAGAGFGMADWGRIERSGVLERAGDGPVDPSRIEHGLAEAIRRRGTVSFTWTPAGEKTRRHEPAESSSLVGAVEVVVEGEDPSAVRLRGQVMVAADQAERLSFLGWHRRTVETGSADAAPYLFVERQWRTAPGMFGAVAEDVRSTLTLGDPAQMDGEGELHVVVDGPIGSEAADLGSVVGGPILVILIAIVLGVVTVVVGEAALDALMLAVGVAILGWLLVASLGRWLIPRLPPLRGHEDSAWWTAWLTLPIVGAVLAFAASLASA